MEIFRWMHDSKDRGSTFFFLPLTTFLARKACDRAPLSHTYIIANNGRMQTATFSDSGSLRLSNGHLSRCTSRLLQVRFE